MVCHPFQHLCKKLSLITRVKEKIEEHMTDEMFNFEHCKIVIILQYYDDIFTLR